MSGERKAHWHLHPGATQHYAQAEAYESRYAARSEDVEFYMRALRSADSILEYGAGAGRLTLPLARNGHQVIAVDTSVPMLNLLRKRLRAEPKEVRTRVKARHGDMRSYRGKGRFSAAVAAFHTVCHLYARLDMVAFLESVKAQLHPGGRLIFDLPYPRIDVPGYDPLAQVRVTEMEGPEGPQLLTQRWYQPQEIRMYLHYAGFCRVSLRSDFSATQRIESETSVFTVSAYTPR